MPASYPSRGPDRADAWRPRRESRSLFHPVRGLRYHVRCWEPLLPDRDVSAPDRDDCAPAARTVFLLHGWMDVSASFQFVVDELPAHWRLLAPDWRGFGLTDRPGADTYWFPDYLGDLDALLDLLAPGEAVDIAGHSMGGNVAALYAGVRPARVRRIVNLEGLGLPPMLADEAPARYARWLDALGSLPELRTYATRDAVAERLVRNNPRLRADRAAFLAQHWARERDDGRFELLGDPAHRRPSATLYRVEEVVACWRRISADVLWVMAGERDARSAFADTAEYRERLSAIRSLERVTIAGAGHMLHHDQPAEVARLIEEFFA